MTQQFTKAEQVFIDRMAYHVENGLSFEDAARAVVADDARIFSSFCDRQHNQYFPTADERGRSAPSRVSKGDVIASELTRRTYNQLRAA